MVRPTRLVRAAAALAAAAVANLGLAAPPPSLDAASSPSSAVRSAVQALRAQHVSSGTPIICSDNLPVGRGGHAVAAVCIGEEDSSITYGVFVVAGSMKNLSEKRMKVFIQLAVRTPYKLVGGCTGILSPKKSYTCTSAKVHHVYPAGGIGEFHWGADFGSASRDVFSPEFNT
ncbi:hypothetical protein ABZ924_34830 [Streptomyces sp. NPDC046876]|uniref:hypothetical protein n=1 Tax=Streptomyces sp. NPDC046876 TaxID=3155616 RepID=UPI0033EFB60C